MSNPDLDTQIDLFEDEARCDEEDIQDTYASLDINIHDPTSIAKNISKELYDTPDLQTFNSILQSMLTIVMRRAKDKDIALKSLLIIDKFGKKIANQKKSISFDYETKISFNELLNTVDESAKLSELQKQIDDLKKVKEQNKLLKEELKKMKSMKYGGGNGNGGDGSGNGIADGDGSGSGSGSSKKKDILDAKLAELSKDFALMKKLPEENNNNNATTSGTDAQASSTTDGSETSDSGAPPPGPPPPGPPPPPGMIGKAGM